MSHSSPPLTPVSLASLLGRIGHEFETRRRIFDLPTARIWRPEDDVDLSTLFLGRPCATPVGPAAGPHSQLAQNIVLAWLGGSRVFELKTVQVLDDLEINRPCIDAETIGYNIEWSQELTVPQSLTEYTKAWMLLAVLRQWEPLIEQIGPDPGAHLFDMSVGYDLAGIQSDKVRAFLDGMANARDGIDALRSEIAASTAFAHLADIEMNPAIADTLTLSTFHGCPPDEISAITKHLIDAHDLDVVVKLNPTLLGIDTVHEVLHDQLGYDEVRLQPQAFVDDLQFDRGIELIEELNAYATDRGRRFGVKLTNTLVVENHRSFMPDETMYVSGPPLHALASSLLDRLAGALPGRLDLPGHEGPIMVSFSAGVTKDNLPATVAMGVNPATVCTDLLKPGGYGRLAPMLKALASDVRDTGQSNLADYRRHQLEVARAAGHRDTVAAHVAHILGHGSNSYHRNGTAKTPREVDHELEMFGCVACNFCVTVCPNDAFTNVKSGDLDVAGLEDRQQYLVFSELCNECGNCLTFCPEDGDPAMIKPRLFTDPEIFALRSGQGFLLENGRIVDARADPDDIARVQALLDRDGGNPLGAKP